MSNLILGLSLLLASSVPPPTPGILCGCEPPITIESQSEFSLQYEGTYRTGDPLNTLTVLPSGTGDSFADIGATIRLRVSGCRGVNGPVVGIPAHEIVLYNPDLVFCELPHSDAGTDGDGWFTFSGTIAAGGCGSGLMVFMDGVYVTTLDIEVNSPDTGVASPGFVDSSDLLALAARLGDVAQWDLCFDFNESGPPTLDSGDLAYLAGTLGAQCP